MEKKMLLKLIQNFVKHAENKGLLESNYATRHLKILFLNMRRKINRVIGSLKKKSDTLLDGMH